MIIPVSPKAYIGRVAEVLEYPTLVIHHLLYIYGIGLTGEMLNQMCFTSIPRTTN